MILVLLLCFACDPQRAASTASSRSDDATVVRVTDGDTIVVETQGGEDRVRLIGLDAPETSVGGGQAAECYGQEATRDLEAMVGSRRVKLVQDEDDRDRFDRRLSYVYRADDGLFVNAELVKRGSAIAIRVAPNEAHFDELRRLEEEARKDKRGLWGACSLSAKEE